MATHDDRMQWSITRRRGVTGENNEASSWKKYKWSSRSLFSSCVFPFFLLYPICSCYSLNPFLPTTEILWPPTYRKRGHELLQHCEQFFLCLMGSG